MIRNIYKKEIHLYSLIIPENFEGFSLKTCAEFLTEEDIINYSKFQVREKKIELLVSRVFLWNVLARYLPSGLSLVNFCIRKDTNGKPFLFLNNEHIPLYFNLSHTKGLVSCVVSLHHPLGVDVEYMDREKSKYIWEYLSRIEKEKIRDTPDDMATYLYKIWTLKEAYLKADGRGLYVPLNSFGFTFPKKKKESDMEGIQLHIQDVAEKKKVGKWHFRIFLPTLQHHLAVAVQMRAVPFSRVFSFHLDDLVFS